MPDKKPNIFERFYNRIKEILLALNSFLSKLFDRIVYSQRATLVVSFLVAVAVCVTINYQDLSYTFFNRGSTTYNLTNVPVEVQADTENYEVTGLPSTVEMTVTGDAADVQVFRNSQSNVAVIANLHDFGEGENVVTFTPANVSTSLTVNIIPANAEVRLDKKTSRTFQVVPELLLGTNQKDGEFATPQLSSTTVTVKATRAQLDSIRTVKALVDASGQNSAFEGTAVIAAYNGSGEKVNVQITPDTIPVSVTLADKTEAQPEQKPAEQKEEDSQNG